MTKSPSTPPTDDVISVSIPTQWTPEQALVVADFLEAVHIAIWRLHGKAMDEVIDRQEMQRIAEDDWADQLGFLSDDIPF